MQDAEQYACLDGLILRESGWRPEAQNPTSTAYGLGQFLDSTWQSTGYEKTSDPFLQLEAMMVYIENRYVTPCAALRHQIANNWY